jgi:hypothetical protein
MNITHPDDFEAMYNDFIEQAIVLRALMDPEIDPETTINMGLDVPSLTAWYNTIHNES